MMKAISITKSLPVTDQNSSLKVEVPRPVPGFKDLLVRIKAVLINPVNATACLGAGWQKEPKILVWDASDVVESVGKEVAGFTPGDQVYYAGELTRAGSNGPILGG